MLTQLETSVVNPSLTLNQPHFIGSSQINGASFSNAFPVLFNSSIALDLSLANNFSISQTGNLHLANPINLVPGQSGIVKLIQDSSGYRTLTFGALWKFTNGVPGYIDTTPFAVNFLIYYVESLTRISCQILSIVQPVIFVPTVNNFDADGNLFIPVGATSADILVVGAGGGVGGSNSSGDGFRPGSGGSGGFTSATLSVTPGETLTVTVGIGGLRAQEWFNGNPRYGPPTTGTDVGGNGTSSSVLRGPTTLISASGGNGGSAYAGGAAGSPNGVSGSYVYAMNDYPPLSGGNNGTGYGLGGHTGAGASNGNTPPGQPGQNGFVRISLN